MWASFEIFSLSANLMGVVQVESYFRPAILLCSILVLLSYLSCAIVR
jgi:hypothetical protein